MARLLESYDRLQSMPFGEWTRRNSDPGLRNMNSQRSILTSALRTGLRNARKRGDAAEVMANLNAANAYGVEATGVGSYEARQTGAGAFEQQTRKQTAMNEQLANKAASVVNGQAPDATPPTAEPTSGGDRFAARAVESRKPYEFSDTAITAAERATLAGNFGEAERRRYMRKQGRDYVDQLVGEGYTPEDITNSIFEGPTAKLGGTPSQLRKAIDKPSRPQQAANLVDEYLDGGFFDTEDIIKRAKRIGGSKESFLAAVARESAKRERNKM